MSGKPRKPRATATTVFDVAQIIEGSRTNAINLRDKLTASIGNRMPVILSHIEAQAILTALTEWASKSKPR